LTSRDPLPAVEALPELSQFFHDVIEDWLQEPDITVACGRWSQGAISEILPAGRGRLLPPIYGGCFAGVRELRLDGAEHHLHIDLGRVHHVRYVVAPSVCFDFKPSFEARLLVLGPGGSPSDHWVVSLMLSCPYDRESLNAAQVSRFFALARRHAEARPDLVEFEVEPSVPESTIAPQLLEILRQAAGRSDGDWRELGALLCPPVGAAAAAAGTEPPCIPLLEMALALRDSSLVIYRERTLIEFKTEKLDGLHRYVEQGHVSWQIGAFDDHHCHLSLGAVSQVLFSAEPVSCQGGGINYTVWFLTPGPCGNPFRRDGYFSVVLNRPYQGNEPRLDVIQPVLDLYRRFRDEPWVAADSRFLEILADGPPPRHPVASVPTG
jgi:hypothetical protein